MVADQLHLNRLHAHRDRLGLFLFADRRRLEDAVLVRRPDLEVERLVVALALAQTHEPVRALAREHRARIAVRHERDFLGIVVVHPEAVHRRVVDVLVVRRVDDEVIPELDVARQHLAVRPRQLQGVRRGHRRRIEGDHLPFAELLVEIAPAVVHRRRRDERVHVRL